MLTHLLIIGGNAGPAIVLLLITGTVAYLRRANISALLSSKRAHAPLQTGVGAGRSGAATG